MHPTIGRKICVITAGIKKYKSIIKKEKKHDRILLSAETKLNSTEILISSALIDSCISHDEFVLVNNVLKEYDTKEAITNHNTSNNLVDMIKEILISEKELTDANYERLKKALSYIENNSIDSAIIGI